MVKFLKAHVEIKTQKDYLTVAKLVMHKYLYTYILSIQMRTKLDVQFTVTY